MPIGKNILAALKSLGMTRADLSKAAGITEASISRYCTGKQEPRAAELHRMSVALGVTMEYLLTGNELPSGNDAGSILREDPVVYGAPKMKSLDTVQRRIDEVIRDLAEIREEIQRSKN